MGAFFQWTPDGGTPQTLTFDIVTTESHEISSTITDHPVEKGTDITDNVRASLNKVTLDVFISNTPILLPAEKGRDGGATTSISLDVPKYSPPLAPTPGAIFNAIGGAISSLFGDGPTPITANVLTYSDKFDAVSETLAILLNLRDTAQLVKVVTSSQLYENMLVENAQLQRDADTGSGANITIELRQLRVVESKLVAAPIPTELRGKKSIAKGPKAPIETPQKKQSMLKALLGKL